jgi:hypothetical protein
LQHVPEVYDGLAVDQRVSCITYSFHDFVCLDGVLSEAQGVEPVGEEFVNLPLLYT